MPGAVLALLLVAAPELRLDSGVPEVERVAAEAWTAQERVLAASGIALPLAPRPVRVALSRALPPGVAAASRPGLLWLRPDLPPGGTAAAVRHEVAHHLLFEACPAASGDRLFHEAFAVAVTGEHVDWSAAEDGHYLSIARALDLLARARSLDVPAARRALARLLAEAPAAPGTLPVVLARRLARCEDGAPWAPLRAEELAQPAVASDALVVLSRHSGEVLASEGAAALAMPFGSTLKPFLLAGAPAPPAPIAPDPAAPGWRCGALPARMDAATALLRSCNGWFQAWAARDPAVVRMGAWGPALVALGLSALPADASEAIGVRPTLRISPLALAHAYRLLAEARPDLVDVLSRNAREGTLARLAASDALAGVAAKTGTVLDADGRPRLGWIVAVDRDVVAVMTRAGRAPRGFASALAAALRRARAPAREAARVQVFGLVPAGGVTGRCAGKAFVLSSAGPRVIEADEQDLADAARAGTLACSGGPWRIRVQGRPGVRTYAGLFTRDPLPGAPPATREGRARRGSELLFRTTRLLYAAGVVAAEDAAARGEARIALARVVDANAAHGPERHAGRAPCDTTHCQVFLGTAAPRLEERAALAAPLRARHWLPFSRGGAEPWRAERTRAQVEQALGTGARALAFAGGRVTFTVDAGDADGRWEERRTSPCEALRAPLKLPACPLRATPDGARVAFEGRGEGHGEGLDLEWAKRSGSSASELLLNAYGPALADP